MTARKKTLNNSDVEIKYECNQGVEVVKGKFQGVQLMLSDELIFVLVTKKDKVERFIPANKIIYIDVFKAGYAKELMNENSSRYIG